MLMTHSTSSLRGMNPDTGQWQIASFAKRFGEPHLHFAYHAAFPLALTPDLLYHLWANFQRDIEGQVLNISWVAVADLLLSSLCREVGHELYEMNGAVRNLLLEELEASPRFGSRRIHELSDFLLDYIQRQLGSDDPYGRDFAEAQHWTALAYTQPQEAARELARRLKQNIEEGNEAEQLRLASVVDTLAHPMAGFVPLISYTRARRSLIQGVSPPASSLDFRSEVMVARVSLPPLAVCRRETRIGKRAA
jgi:hypothetical protein